MNLLVPLKRSPEYRVIRSQLAEFKPLDAWQANGVSYFVFRLRPTDQVASNGHVRFALFTMNWEVGRPISAVVVEPMPDKQQAQVQDLRQPGKTYTVPLNDLGVEDDK